MKKLENPKVVEMPVRQGNGGTIGFPELVWQQNITGFIIGRVYEEGGITKNKSLGLIKSRRAGRP
jgi:hypothetical protein